MPVSAPQGAWACCQGYSQDKASSRPWAEPCPAAPGQWVGRAGGSGTPCWRQAALTLPVGSFRYNGEIECGPLFPAPVQPPGAKCLNTSALSFPLVKVSGRLPRGDEWSSYAQPKAACRKCLANTRPLSLPSLSSWGRSLRDPGAGGGGDGGGL